jgi:predicted amidophosphoribosyltransferase
MKGLDKVKRICKHCGREIKSQRYTYNLCPACRQCYRNKEKIIARALWNLDRVEKIEEIVNNHKMMRNFKFKTLREKKNGQAE